jgi:hypothetical protein
MNSTLASNMNSRPVSHRSRENPLKMCCVAALTILCVKQTLQANIIDDLFQYAAQQQSNKTTTVPFAMASNEVTRNNLVGYSVGTLTYYPPRFTGRFFVPATFASDADGIKQYFSDRQYFLPQASELRASYPFDPTNTDPLTVSIGRDFLSPNYSINPHSSKWGFNFSFIPSFDVSTKILYGTWGNSFLTVSLGSPTTALTPTPNK